MDPAEIINKPVENIGFPERYICTVFEEMRMCAETGNYSYLPGLIEEAQTYANRMEAKLSDVSRYEDMKTEYKRMKLELEEGKNE